MQHGREDTRGTCIYIYTTAVLLCCLLLRYKHAYLYVALLLLRQKLPTSAQKPDCNACHTPVQHTHVLLYILLLRHKKEKTRKKKLLLYLLYYILVTFLAADVKLYVHTDVVIFFATKKKERNGREMEEGTLS